MKSPLKPQSNLAANAPVGTSPADYSTQVPERQAPARLSSDPRRSPEAESFRALLKSRMPREKASPALLQKIRQITKNPA